MEKLKKGELDAVIVVGGKPYVSVTNFNNDGRFHLATVDYAKSLQNDYLPAELTSKDYPNLIPDGETVETIAVPSVLAVYNWPPSTERSRKLARFVDAFFTKFAALQSPPFHPKWKEVSLTAPLAGWNRLPLAQQWLLKHGIEPVRQKRFEAFLQEEDPAAAQSESDTKTLFRQFQAWDAEQKARAHINAPEGKTQEGAQEGKIRNRDHVYRSATHAAPPRRPPRRSQPTTTGALDTSTGARRSDQMRTPRLPPRRPGRLPSRKRGSLAEPVSRPRAPFGGPAQGVLTTDHPSTASLRDNLILR